MWVTGFPPTSMGSIPGQLIAFATDKLALGWVFPKDFGSPCQFSYHKLLHIH
ncbi:hypothetical protein B7P43_G11302 [Cryptotermes secundus]|uniref:Uncharacterized protein n=1 Tax=Cryptotermes secundus TaxID=105785 RepID=A0A2J7PRX1_9NEOP|nr:hypothetical protein B7P43_G11302 [Cryptotermes secundus]